MSDAPVPLSAPTTAVAAPTAAPALRFADGTVEALKWLALALMLGDHVNKYLFGAKLPLLFEAGRLCMPVFAVLLGYNLARPGAVEGGAAWRTAKRLLIFGALACIPCALLGSAMIGGWWPLNVLFELAVLAGVIHLAGRGRLGLAVLLFVIGGALAEYWWPAIGLGLAAWGHARRPRWSMLLAGLVACAALALINGNHWALAALPLLALATRIDLPVPRVRDWFYWFYPLHLAALAACKLAGA